MNWRLYIPGVILLVWATSALFGAWLPLTPNHVSLPEILQTPNFSAWLGYDELGRPVLDRLIVGANVSFLVAVQVISFSAVLGTTVGMLAGWYGGLIDRLIVYIIDVFLAFPGILLAIALAGLLGPGIENVVFALTAVGWIGFARLARAQTLSLKQRDHVSAARSLGADTPRILRYHVAPLLLAPIIVEATFGIAGVVIAEAGLSFLGLGVQPPTASWGSMLRDGTRYMLMAPHLVLAPGVALMLVVLAVNLIGDQLRDWLDVK
ncbi:MAG: ABC transporter permease [Pseudomonadota bacterium]